MRLSGSAPERPFPRAAALAVAAAGIVAMVGGSVWLASHPGLGLRPKIGPARCCSLPGLVVPCQPECRPCADPPSRAGCLLASRCRALLGSAGLIEVQALVVPP
jgi:hypothetical protein